MLRNTYKRVSTFQTVPIFQAGTTTKFKRLHLLWQTSLRALWFLCGCVSMCVRACLSLCACVLIRVTVLHSPWSHAFKHLWVLGETCIFLQSTISQTHTCSSSHLVLSPSPVAARLLHCLTTSPQTARHIFEIWPSFLFSCCHDSHTHQQEWLERDVKASVVKAAIVLHIFVSLATCTVFNVDMHRIILKVESRSHYCCLQYSFTSQKNQ